MNEDVGREFYHKYHHPWFLYMGKAFAATGDEKYFEAWKCEYLDFIEKYPCPSTGKITYGDDINSYGWQSWHQNTMASRIVDLPSTFEYFKGAKGFDFDWLTTFLKVYHELVTYSMANLFYMEQYNYRFSQYKAHCLAAIYFPEFKTSTSWLRTAATQLSGYPDLSLNDDGCLNELDAMYHAGEAGGYYRVFVAARENNKMSFFKSDFLKKVEKACNFSTDYYYPNYLWECMNDVRQTTRSNGRNSIYYFSEMFPDNNKFKYMASWRQQGTEPVEKLSLYKTSGYYMLRSGWKESDMMLIYKNNYDADRGFGHVHFDNGTIGFYNNGRIFLPDPGCYTYGDKKGQELDKAKAEMRHASAHNTVTKNRTAITFECSKGKYVASGEKDGIIYAVAENKSYPDLTHRRSVWMLDGKYAVVSDAAFLANSSKCPAGTSLPDFVQIDVQNTVIMAPAATTAMSCMPLRSSSTTYFGTPNLNINFDHCTFYNFDVNAYGIICFGQAASVNFNHCVVSSPLAKASLIINLPAALSPTVTGSSIGGNYFYSSTANAWVESTSTNKFLTDSGITVSGNTLKASDTPIASTANVTNLYIPVDPEKVTNGAGASYSTKTWKTWE